MALEVELKLTLSPHHIESLKLQPLFRSKEIKELGTQVLKNTYYDTPDQQLSANKVALRIREKGDQLIQTLKSRGTSEAGMHSRHEWEWIIPDHQLDFSHLETAQWPKSLHCSDLQNSIIPVFSTDFTRTTWILDTVDHAGEPLKVEIALDQGEVTYQAGDQLRSDPLCELELELMEGNPTSMVKFAIKLARHVPLYISDISKAQRGYRLHNPENYSVTRTAFTPEKDDCLETVFTCLIRDELSLWPSYLEAWQFNGDWRYITLALESLRNTSALYETFSDIIPADPDGCIDKLLTRFIRQLRDLDAWRRTADLCGSADSDWLIAQEEKAAKRMTVLLQTIEPGVLALLISEQLIQQSWQKRWTDTHKENAGNTLLKG